MREIKFRAWDKEEKRMYYVGGFHHILEDYYTEPERQFEPDIQFVYLLEESPRTCQKVWQHPASDVELMQFTGLTDRQGKEIYESDVVRWDYKGIDYIRIVTWDADQAMFLPN